MAAQALQSAWYRGAWWLWLLRPLELLFRSVAALRRTLYSRGLRPVYQAEKPVVVVGNITVGGTGKTPVVIALVERLQAAGLRPGVVSRGYGASGSRFPHRLEESSTAADCGDEPLLIYRRTGCPCVVDPNRGRAVRELLAGNNIDIVISDDGLQHYALARDLEIALVDAKVGLGNGFCLPAGPLREPPARLERVDFVLERDGGDSTCAVKYRHRALVNIETGEERPFEPASVGLPVYIVAGIGQPEQFFHSMSKQGFVHRAFSFSDHHSYSAADFAGLGDKAIIMTEKDAVKCRGLAGDNAWYVRMEANLPEQVVRSVIQLAQA